MENGIPTTVLAPDGSEQEARVEPAPRNPGPIGTLIGEALRPHVAPLPRVLVRCPSCRQLEHAPVTETSWCYCRPGGTLMRPVRQR